MAGIGIAKKGLGLLGKKKKTLTLGKNQTELQKLKFKRWEKSSSKSNP